MVRILTLDSSVIIAALREQEEKHKECLGLIEKIIVNCINHYNSLHWREKVRPVLSKAL